MLSNMPNEISLYPLGELPAPSALTSDQQKDVRDLVYAMLRNLDGTVTYGTVSEVFRLSERGIQLGSSDFDVAPFSVTMAGLLTATGANISGTITATTGTIGGFSIGADYIRDAANTFGLSSTVTTGDDVRFWAGAAFADRATAPARIHESGSAFFADVTVAGTIRSSVFERDVVSAVGGQLLIANADTLDDAMTALDSSTLKIKGETTFAVNDILHLKNGTDEEYMRVTAIGSAPTYTVTRDLAGAYTADNNPAWAAGTAVVVEGNTDGATTKSGGYLRALGAGTNSPRYSVFKRTGFTYNGVTEYIGLGNLNGLLDYVSDEYGQVIGTSTDGFLAFDPTNGLRISAAKISIAQRFTSGFALKQGKVLAMESDGLTYPVRYTDSAPASSLTSVSANSTAAARADACIVGHYESAGIFKCTALGIIIFGGNAVYESSIITNDPVALGAISTATVNAATFARVCPVLTTTALVAYVAGTTAAGKVISSLDGTPVVNGATTISTNASHPHVDRYSDTVVPCVYIDTSTGDINGSVLTVGATSFTAGTPSQLIATIGQKITGFKRFGSSNYYILAFEDTSNNQKVVCIEFNGTTFNVGTPITIINTTANLTLNIDGLDETSAIICTLEGGANIKAAVISRSGTTLTNNGQVTLQTNAKNANGFAFGVKALGANTFIYFYPTTSANTPRLGVGRVTGTTPSNLGSTLSISSVAEPSTLGSIFHCLKVNPKTYGIFYQDNTGSAKVFFNTLNPPNTFEQKIGLCAEDTALSAVGGVVMIGFSDDVSGLSAGSPYYSDVDGGLMTRSQGGLKRFGIALSSTTFKVE